MNRYERDFKKSAEKLDALVNPTFNEPGEKAGLFAPKWMSDDEGRAVAAVEKLKNPGDLIKAALEARCPQAAYRAVELLEDQQSLYAVAMAPKGRSWNGFRLLDLPRIFDMDKNVRMIAVSRLEDEDKLLDIAP